MGVTIGKHNGNFNSESTTHRHVGNHFGLMTGDDANNFYHRKTEKELHNDDPIGLSLEEENEEEFPEVAPIPYSSDRIFKRRRTQSPEDNRRDFVGDPVPRGDKYRRIHQSFYRHIREKIPVGKGDKHSSSDENKEDTFIQIGIAETSQDNSDSLTGDVTEPCPNNQKPLTNVGKQVSSGSSDSEDSDNGSSTSDEEYKRAIRLSLKDAQKTQKSDGVEDCVHERQTKDTHSGGEVSEDSEVKHDSSNIPVCLNFDVYKTRETDATFDNRVNLTDSFTTKGDKSKQLHQNLNYILFNQEKLDSSTSSDADSSSSSLAAYCKNSSLKLADIPVVSGLSGKQTETETKKILHRNADDLDNKETLVFCDGNLDDRGEKGLSKEKEEMHTPSFGKENVPNTVKILIDHPHKQRRQGHIQSASSGNLVKGNGANNEETLCKASSGSTERIVEGGGQDELKSSVKSAKKADAIDDLKIIKVKHKYHRTGSNSNPWMEYMESCPGYNQGDLSLDAQLKKLKSDQNKTEEMLTHHQVDIPFPLRRSVSSPFPFSSMGMEDLVFSTFGDSSTLGISDELPVEPPPLDMTQRFRRRTSGNQDNREESFTDEVVRRSVSLQGSAVNTFSVDGDSKESKEAVKKESDRSTEQSNQTFPRSILKKSKESTKENNTSIVYGHVHEEEYDIHHIPEYKIRDKKPPSRPKVKELRSQKMPSSLSVGNTSFPGTDKRPSSPKRLHHYFRRIKVKVVDDNRMVFHLRLSPYVSVLDEVKDDQSKVVKIRTITFVPCEMESDEYEVVKQINVMEENVEKNSCIKEGEIVQNENHEKLAKEVQMSTTETESDIFTFLATSGENVGRELGARPKDLKNSPRRRWSRKSFRKKGRKENSVEIRNGVNNGKSVDSEAVVVRGNGKDMQEDTDHGPVGSLTNKLAGLRNGQASQDSGENESVYDAGNDVSNQSLWKSEPSPGCIVGIKPESQQTREVRETSLPVLRQMIQASSEKKHVTENKQTSLDQHQDAEVIEIASFEAVKTTRLDQQQSAKVIGSTLFEVEQTTEQLTSLDQQQTAEVKETASMEVEQTTTLDQQQTAEVKETVSMEVEQTTTLDQQQTAEVKETASVEEEQTTLDQQQTVEVKETASVEEEQTTLGQQQTVEVKETASVEEEQTTLGQQQTGEVKETASVEEEQTTLGQQQTAEVKETASVEVEQTITLDQQQIREFKETASVEVEQTTTLDQQQAAEFKETASVEVEQTTTLDQQQTAEVKETASVEVEQTTTLDQQQTAEVKETASVEVEQTTTLDQQQTAELKETASVEVEQTTLDQQQTAELKETASVEVEQTTTLDQQHTAEVKETASMGVQQTTTLDQQQTAEVKETASMEVQQPTEQTLLLHHQLATEVIETVPFEIQQSTENKQTISLDQLQNAEVRETATLEGEQTTEVEEPVSLEAQTVEDQEEVCLEPPLKIARVGTPLELEPHQELENKNMISLEEVRLTASVKLQHTTEVEETGLTDPHQTRECEEISLVEPLLTVESKETSVLELQQASERRETSSQELQQMSETKESSLPEPKQTSGPEDASIIVEKEGSIRKQYTADTRKDAQDEADVLVEQAAAKQIRLDSKSEGPKEEHRPVTRMEGVQEKMMKTSESSVSHEEILSTSPLIETTAPIAPDTSQAIPEPNTSQAIPAVAAVTARAPSSYEPRQCHIVKWASFRGYGFNLQAGKNGGHFIGKVDIKSPAEASGLKEGDQVIAVNGINVEGDPHLEVIEKIKSDGNQTSLLVVDKMTADYFKYQGIAITVDMPEITYMTSQRKEKEDTEVRYMEESLLEDLLEIEKAKCTQNTLPSGIAWTVLCVDTSNSMMDGGILRQRIAVRDFLHELEQTFEAVGEKENVALVTCGRQAEIVQTMTSDYKKVAEALDGLPCGGVTPLMTALLISSTLLKHASGKKGTFHGFRAISRIILFTDGKPTPALMQSGPDRVDVVVKDTQKTGEKKQPNVTWTIRSNTVRKLGGVGQKRYEWNLEYLCVGDRLGVLRSPEGKLHFYINEMDQGVIANGVPANIYACMSLFGQCTKVSAYASKNSSIKFSAHGFHDKCGETVRISDGGRTAERFESIANAVVFSSQPLMDEELFEVKIEKLDGYSHHSIEFGVTTFKPDSLAQIPPTLTGLMDDNDEEDHESLEFLLGARRPRAVLKRDTRKQYSKDTEETEEAIVEFCQEMHRQPIAVYCVPVGDANMGFLDSVARASRGAIVQPITHVKKLARYTVRMMTASHIGGHMLIGQPSVDGKMFKNVVNLMSPSTNQKELEEMLQHVCSKKKKNDGSDSSDSDSSSDDDEVDTNAVQEGLPPPGTRVRRGPNWEDGNRDGDGVGTITGHSSSGKVCVQWDNGQKHAYTYGDGVFDETYEILPVDEAKFYSAGQSIQVGSIVRRGPDWQWKNQDGGPENTGVVISVEASGAVEVCWPNGNKNTYRYGYGGLYDVVLCDPSDPFGTKAEVEAMNKKNLSFSEQETAPQLASAEAEEISDIVTMETDEHTARAQMSSANKLAAPCSRGALKNKNQQDFIDTQSDVKALESVHKSSAKSLGYTDSDITQCGIDMVEEKNERLKIHVPVQYEHEGNFKTDDVGLRLDISSMNFGRSDSPDFESLVMVNNLDEEEVEEENSHEDLKDDTHIDLKSVLSSSTSDEEVEQPDTARSEKSVNELSMCNCFGEDEELEVGKEEENRERTSSSHSSELALADQMLISTQGTPYYRDSDSLLNETEPLLQTGQVMDPYEVSLDSVGKATNKDFGSERLLTRGAEEISISQEFKSAVDAGDHTSSMEPGADQDSPCFDENDDDGLDSKIVEPPSNSISVTFTAGELVSSLPSIIKDGDSCSSEAEVISQCSGEAIGEPENERSKLAAITSEVCGSGDLLINDPLIDDTSGSLPPSEANISLLSSAAESDDTSGSLPPSEANISLLSSAAESDDTSGSLPPPEANISLPSSAAESDDTSGSLPPPEANISLPSSAAESDDTSGSLPPPEANISVPSSAAESDHNIDIGIHGKFDSENVQNDPEKYRSVDEGEELGFTMNSADSVENTIHAAYIDVIKSQQGPSNEDQIGIQKAVIDPQIHFSVEKVNRENQKHQPAALTSDEAVVSDNIGTSNSLAADGVEVADQLQTQLCNTGKLKEVVQTVTEASTPSAVDIADTLSGVLEDDMNKTPLEKSNTQQQQTEPSKDSMSSASQEQAQLMIVSEREAELSDSHKTADLVTNIGLVKETSVNFSPESSQIVLEGMQNSEDKNDEEEVILKESNDSEDKADTELSSVFGNNISEDRTIVEETSLRDIDISEDKTDIAEHNLKESDILEDRKVIQVEDNGSNENGVPDNKDSEKSGMNESDVTEEVTVWNKDVSEDRTNTKKTALVESNISISKTVIIEVAKEKSDVSKDRRNVEEVVLKARNIIQETKNTEETVLKVISISENGIDTGKVIPIENIISDGKIEMTEVVLQDSSISDDLLSTQGTVLKESDISEEKTEAVQVVLEENNISEDKIGAEKVVSKEPDVTKEWMDTEQSVLKDSAMTEERKSRENTVLKEKPVLSDTEVTDLDMHNISDVGTDMEESVATESNVSNIMTGVRETALKDIVISEDRTGTRETAQQESSIIDVRKDIVLKESNISKDRTDTGKALQESNISDVRTATKEVVPRESNVSSTVTKVVLLKDNNILESRTDAEEASLRENNISEDRTYAREAVLNASGIAGDRTDTEHPVLEENDISEDRADQTEAVLKENTPVYMTEMKKAFLKESNISDIEETDIEETASTTSTVTAGEDALVDDTNEENIPVAGNLNYSTQGETDMFFTPEVSFRASSPGPIQGNDIDIFMTPDTTSRSKFSSSETRTENALASGDYPDNSQEQVVQVEQNAPRSDTKDINQRPSLMDDRHILESQEKDMDSYPSDVPGVHLDFKIDDLKSRLTVESETELRQGGSSLNVSRESFLDGNDSWRGSMSELSDVSSLADFSDVNYQWFWKPGESEGPWEIYDDKQNKKIEKAYQRNTKSMTIIIGHDVYRIIFSKMQKRHTVNKKVFDIQRSELASGDEVD